MASKDEAEWDQAHEVDTDTGRPTKELYTDNDPVTTIKGKINNLKVYYLARKRFEDVVQGHFNQVKDLISDWSTKKVQFIRQANVVRDA